VSQSSTPSEPGTDSVLFSVEDHVSVITINRPRARNAINDVVAEGIEAAVDRLEGDDALWVGILTGVPPVFSAGADLKMISAGLGARLATQRGGFGGLTRRQRTKPIIAAVEGPALAGGTELVLSCDLVVASTAASFGLPEVKRSLVAAAGGLFRLPRRIPFNVAMECALTGDAIEAEVAHGFGLVNHLTEPGGALDGARALAARVTANAPVAVRQTRRVMIEASLADDATGWRLSEEALQAAVSSADFSEGLNAFIEKRPPLWTGR
jgi:enoyl-CoA hydratase